MSDQINQPMFVVPVNTGVFHHLETVSPILEQLPVHKGVFPRSRVYAYRYLRCPRTHGGIPLDPTGEA